ncbi:MAG: hypothetical protein K2X29_08225, partial [Candidatus Obscuribacterales bacterium]|nr:hypothetical protein [Candidatus Obscuribacterales bacterium]
MHSSSNFKRDLAIFFGLLGLLFYLNSIPLTPTLTPQKLQIANQELSPGSSLMDADDNLLTLKRPDGKTWHFGYTRKESGVIFKTYYFIVSRVVEPSGKTWTLTDEKKHLWTASTGETWTGDYDLAKNLYGDYRFETILKRLKNGTIVMMIHPSGSVVYANTNGSVSTIDMPNGQTWQFAYDTSDADKNGGPDRHKPISVKEPLGRTWTKGKDGWTANDGKEFKGDFSFTEYRIGSGLNFANIKRASQETNLADALSPTNNTVTFDTKAHKVLSSERPDSSSSAFAYDYSGFFSSLKWCQEPTGKEYKKDGNGNWTTSDNQAADAKFYDESDLASHIGYGALLREKSKLTYVWHATGCDIEAEDDATVTAIHYADGTSRQFWYQLEGSVFKTKELVKLLDRDGTLWMKESNKTWKSNKGETFNGSFFVDSDLTHNVWGYGTFMKIAGSNTEITFSGCPSHVARRECRRTGNGGPGDNDGDRRGGGGGGSGGNDEECHDEYYVVP